MSGISVKVLHLPWIQQLQKKCQLIFSRKYLLLTNTGISVGFSGAGDYIQQRLEIHNKKNVKWNTIRTARVGATGFLIGPACHFWFIFLDRLLPGRTLRIVGKKILLDTIVISPVCISLYLGVLGYLEGMKTKAIVEDIADKGVTLMKADVVIWPPAQFINFCFLPTHLRVLYDNVISLGFDWYFSYVKFGGKESLSNSSEEVEDLNGTDGYKVVPIVTNTCDPTLFCSFR